MKPVSRLSWSAISWMSSSPAPLSQPEHEGSPCLESWLSKEKPYWATLMVSEDRDHLDKGNVLVVCGRKNYGEYLPGGLVGIEIAAGELVLAVRSTGGARHFELGENNTITSPAICCEQWIN